MDISITAPEETSLPGANRRRFAAIAFKSWLTVEFFSFISILSII